jgi:hypothetical protein
VLRLIYRVLILDGSARRPSHVLYTLDRPQVRIDDRVNMSDYIARGNYGSDLLCSHTSKCLLLRDASASWTMYKSL